MASSVSLGLDLAELSTTHFRLREIDSKRVISIKALRFCAAQIAVRLHRNARE
jgi:hypothetical protein